MQQPQQPEKILRWVKASDPKALDINIQVGDRIRIYGTETTVEGFYGSYNEGLGRWETIILTTKRGDPFERSIDAIEVNADIEFVSPFKSAPAFPVEEKPEEFKEWAKGVAEMYAHQIHYNVPGPGDSDFDLFDDRAATFQAGADAAYQRLTESRPSPVIEIGEKGEIRAKPSPAALEAAARSMNSLYELSRRDRSHPAPALIVGEREEEAHVHVNLPNGAMATVSPDASPELLNALTKMTDLAKAMPDAPTEQALPEEADKDWESRKIDRLAEVIGMSEDHIRELQEEIHQKGMEFTQLLAEFKTMQAQLESAHALIKEKQEWINSHL